MSDCTIVFTFRDQYGDFQIERLRASQAGSCYQLESIPQFTPSVSQGDIVSAVMEEGELHFEMIMDASGNSTIQVYFFDETQMETAFEFIAARGCNWEAYPEKKLLAVNVPDWVQYAPVQIYFEKGEEDGKWTFKESCLSHY